MHERKLKVKREVHDDVTTAAKHFVLTIHTVCP